eukprot:5164820-Pleurochrysis_carterae.AAC.1
MQAAVTGARTLTCAGAGRRGHANAHASCRAGACSSAHARSRPGLKTRQKHEKGPEGLNRSRLSAASRHGGNSCDRVKDGGAMLVSCASACAWSFARHAWRRSIKVLWGEGRRIRARKCGCARTW